MKLSIRSLALVLPLALTSCETLTGVAPQDTPRVEVELAVNVDAAFLDALVGVDGSSELVAAIKRTVREKADLGLRFYPTLSESYEQSDRRPPYLMTVDVSSLTVLFEHEMIEREDAEPLVETRVDKLDCSVSASVEKRRKNAPPLVVATSSTSSQVRAEHKREVVESRPGFRARAEDPSLKVLEQDILKAVELAADKALKAMRTPIDREFASRQSDAERTGATAEGA